MYKIFANKIFHFQEKEFLNDQSWISKLIGLNCTILFKEILIFITWFDRVIHIGVIFALIVFAYLYCDVITLG